jgi:hypothetical protein
MGRFDWWIFKKLLQMIIAQGQQHSDMKRMWEEIFHAHQEEFTEDTGRTLKMFIHESIDKFILPGICDSEFSRGDNL